MVLKKRCEICGRDIGLMEPKIVVTEDTVCKECADKAGLTDMDSLLFVNAKMAAEWIDDPSKRIAFIEQRNQWQEKKRKEEEEQKQKLAEERRIAEEKAMEEAIRFERERFPEGRVRVKIVQVSFTEIGAAFNRGGALDYTLQKLQDAGCKIMNVSCFASGSNNDYIQAIIIYHDVPARFNE